MRCVLTRIPVHQKYPSAQNLRILRMRLLPFLSEEMFLVSWDICKLAPDLQSSFSREDRFRWNVVSDPFVIQFIIPLWLCWNCVYFSCCIAFNPHMSSGSLSLSTSCFLDSCQTVPHGPNGRTFRAQLGLLSKGGGRWTNHSYVSIF